MIESQQWERNKSEKKDNSAEKTETVSVQSMPLTSEGKES